MRIKPIPPSFFVILQPQTNASFLIYLDMNKPVRVRFAPSPTGALHIGGVRTALFNYILARQTGGQFLLRIEDTDQTRQVAWAEQYIVDSLQWLGIMPDESPWQGGPHAPYRQSERKAIYHQYVQQLVASGHAYYAFDTEEELNALRERLVAAKVDNLQYNAATRGTMKNSFTLTEAEVKTRLDAGEPYVIRFNMPRKEEVRFHDLIRGWIMVHSSTLDDKVLMKSDGMPTYHLANVVDDYLMQITHVIRGEEWLPSAPLHVLLYKAFGWEQVMPQFAHLPLLLRPDGNGKLSKRDADAHGFPIFPLQWTSPEGEQVAGFREAGYLPEAMINFLALLGWNPGNDQEIFDLDALKATFSLERINKAGAKFDIKKAQWFNQHYLRQKPDEQLVALLQAGLQTQNISADASKAAKIVALMKDRVTFPHDFWREAGFLFEAPTQYDAQVIAKSWTPEAVAFLESFLNGLKQVPAAEWQADTLKHLLHETIEKQGLKIGKVMPALRVSLTGAGAGPDLAAIMEILGSEPTLARIGQALEKIAVKN